MNVSDRLRVHAGSVLTTTDRVLVEAADEIDRLRALVEAAPHEMGCAAPYGQPGRCWKSIDAALAAKGE